MKEKQQRSIITIYNFLLSLILVIRQCSSFSIIDAKRSILERKFCGDSQLFSSSSAVTRAAKATKEIRDKDILERDGEYFKFDRVTGKVEFGSTSSIITSLSPLKKNTKELIEKWLQDDRGIALSIWDENLLTELNDKTYRLQLMMLQFVSISLAPSVDVEMWTSNEDNKPIFYIQSIGFDPNMSLLPGMPSPSALAVEISVAGTMQVNSKGDGVTGKFGFVSRGNSPRPLRFLPEPVIRTTARLVNRTVKMFCIQSFEKGASLAFSHFLQNELSKSETEQ